MELKLNKNLSKQYHSGSQIARILTEAWVAENMYCPRCGHPRIKPFENNRPVADFYCPSCLAEFELKSKRGTIEHKVNDGAYDAMIKRIMSDSKPDFFFMNYSAETWTVRDFMIVPKYFFVPGVIEKRKPLADTARRAGWTGCNILLDQIPMQGRIYIVKDGVCQNPETVVKSLNKSQWLTAGDLDMRGWLFDVLNCVNSIQSVRFSLNEIYRFEPALQEKHPENHNIQAKIRQQLQVLRDRGYVEFLGNGQYRKL